METKRMPAEERAKAVLSILTDQRRQGSDDPDPTEMVAAVIRAAEKEAQPRRPWWVWETEIPEEGASLFEATTEDEAMRLYEESCGGRPEEVKDLPTEEWLSARPMTLDDVNRDELAASAYAGGLHQRIAELEGKAAKRITLAELMEGDRDFRLPACDTVDELIEVLQDLPPDLRIKQEFEDGVKPVIFNQKTDPQLSFAENDGLWDDDDEVDDEEEEDDDDEVANG